MSLEDVQRFLTSPMVTVSGSNQDFMLSWWPHRNDPNVLWLFFEDLKKDLSTCVDRIAQFMGVEMTTKLKEKVLEFSSFEYMLKNKEKFQGEEHFVSRPVQGGQLDSTWKPQMGMVRADGGQIGQGRTGIPPPILHLIQQRWDESVGKAFNFPTYEDMYKAGTILKD